MQNMQSYSASGIVACFRTLVCGIAPLVIASTACAHGGVYVGPPGSFGPGQTAPVFPGPGTGSVPGPAAPSIATSGGAGSAPSELSSWTDWWALNRAPYLALKRAVREGLIITGSQDDPTRAQGLSILDRAAIQRLCEPVLVGLLEKPQGVDLTTAAEIALGRLGLLGGSEHPGRGIAALQHALVDSNQEIGESAAIALGILRSSDVAPALAGLLANDERGRVLVGEHNVSTRTRAFAALGLGLLCEHTHVNRTRQLAARALCDILELENNGNFEVQSACVIALGLAAPDVDKADVASAPWISRQTVVRYLEGILQDDKRREVVRAHVPEALARLVRGAPQVLADEVEALLIATLRGLPRHAAQIEDGIVQALGQLATTSPAAQERDVRKLLAHEVEDGAQQARFFALIALAEIGARAPTEGDGEEGERECRNLLTSELVRGKSRMKPWAALALGLMERKLADRKAKPGLGVCELLRDALRDARAGEEVGATAIALGLARDAKAAPLLLDKLEHFDEDRGLGSCALALGMINCSEARDALRARLRASRFRPFVLEQCASALALIGDSALALELTDMLTQARGQAALSSLASALGAVGDARVLSRLVEQSAKSDLSASSRAFGVVALGLICDPADLPWWNGIASGLNYAARTSTLLAGDGTGVLEIL